MRGEGGESHDTERIGRALIKEGKKQMKREYKEEETRARTR